MDRKTLNEALRLLTEHRPFARAVVVKSVGSVPGKVGSTMIVREDGSTLGTVGGAALEEKVKELAAEALSRQRGDLHHFDLQKWREGGLPSLCGGSVDIAIEYVAASPHLLLWGGGHVAHALAEAATPLGYDYSVADDRPDWIGPDRFPSAVTRALTSPEQLWEKLRPSEFTHLYVLGYDARKDLEVLRRSVEGFPGYLGLIASETKREHLFADLRRAGIAETSLARIRSPIGLSIGAETPAEIAVSIVAELIRDRHLDSASARAKPSRPPLRSTMGSAPLSLRINGHPATVPCPPERILLDLLREDLDLTGTKRGCDLGTCGCCTVLVDGRPTLSCLTLARLVEGRHVETIEGISPPQGLSAIQRAFVETGATQCGFCTPGFIVTATALLKEHPEPTRDEVVQAVSGNLCRCTGYTKIIDAILLAAQQAP